MRNMLRYYLFYLCNPDRNSRPLFRQNRRKQSSKRDLSIYRRDVILTRLIIYDRTDDQLILDEI
jgi:hypothetical protein